MMGLLPFRLHEKHESQNLLTTSGHYILCMGSLQVPVCTEGPETGKDVKGLLGDWDNTRYVMCRLIEDLDLVDQDLTNVLVRMQLSSL